MALPRLPAKIEHRVVKRACGLSPRLIRRLIGPPPRLDGQELAPDIQMLLALAKLNGETSLVEGRTVEQARAENRAEVPVVCGPPRPMARVDALTIPGPGGEMPARLYVALGAPQPPQPMLVYYHGGGWVIGDLDTHDSACRFLAEHSGCRVLSIDYRLAPEHPFPIPVEDAVAAFAWAHEHAAELGADPERMAVGGDSAGGNLSTALCLQNRDAGSPQPAMQLLLYPVTDAVGGQQSRDTFAEGFLLTREDMEWFENHYIPDGIDDDEPRASMMRAADVSRLPPAYVATCGFDPLRDEGEIYAARMREAGVQVVLQRQSGQIHGFANLTAICPSARTAMLEVAGALRMGLGLATAVPAAIPA
ncbi:MAG TPA: alpha/beta hydrolase [Solirubrobacterales bacterium]|nr:alpha/beta hydrolase [Solirubrobacterales bacterium]